MSKESKTKKWDSIIAMMIGIPMLVTVLVMGMLSKPSDNHSKPDFRALVSKCKDAVRERAKYQSKLDFHQFTAQHFVLNGKDFIRGQVDMMNGFGAMIPKTYECTFSGNTVSKVIFANGSR